MCSSSRLSNLASVEKSGDSTIVPPVAPPLSLRYSTLDRPRSVATIAPATISASDSTLRDQTRSIIRGARLLQPKRSATDIYHSFFQPFPHGSMDGIVRHTRWSWPLLGQKVVPDCRSLEDTVLTRPTRQSSVMAEAAIHRWYGPPTFCTSEKGTPSAGSSRNTRSTRAPTISL